MAEPGIPGRSNRSLKKRRIRHVEWLRTTQTVGTCSLEGANHVGEITSRRDFTMPVNDDQKLARRILDPNVAGSTRELQGIVKKTNLAVLLRQSLDDLAGVVSRPPVGDKDLDL